MVGGQWVKDTCSSRPGCPLMAKDRGRVGENSSEQQPNPPPPLLLSALSHLKPCCHYKHTTPNTHTHTRAFRFELSAAVRSKQRLRQNMRRTLQGEFDFHIIFTRVLKQTRYMCVTCPECTQYICMYAYIYVCL